MIQLHINKHCIFILLFFSVTLLSVDAQEECSTVLSKAQKLYDAGVIEQIPKMLQPCIESGFTSEEKLQAYKLIIMSYVFDNNTQKAETAMLDFLNRYPEYEILPADQAEFIQLFKTYRTLPIASFGIILGTNISNIRTIKLYVDPKTKGSYSTSGFMFQAGVSYKRYIIDKFDINLEGLYVQSSYQYNRDSITASNTQSFTETQKRIEIPLTLIYYLYTFNKFIPYIRTGLNFTYLLNSSASISRTASGSSKPFIDPNVSLVDNRIPFQVMLVFGAGISYKLKRSDISLDIRYNLGFKNQVIENNRYINLDPHTTFLYIDNDFNYDNLYFSLSYAYKFYKPEKR